MEPLMREDMLKEHCIYCGSSLSELDWVSEWIGNRHYKVTKCKCRAGITVKVDFMGSGHDSWEGKKNPLMEKVKKPRSGGVKIRTLDNLVAMMVAK